ncbi:hypothetical protein ISF_00945 [Cordyceps fumosorosea ARSEF 2679]|uniref:DUF7053 domain-containing protein n=1 Tax=Cordyceps fumosorosea (strain ARSEF 2679) TaxID=1081104 RepID=A0A162LQ82_CORFA|nr:hypothetical protein ISF_00945 [Cordyceps fumosorosea ARSEF 2679]OAA74044.1 hypothetical protein ISF_00945 [Cordyceps fumosorosea ARSEF 2679]
MSSNEPPAKPQSNYRLNSLTYTVSRSPGNSPKPVLYQPKDNPDSFWTHTIVSARTAADSTTQVVTAWFNTTTTLLHVSAVPAGVPAAKLVQGLQDHENYIKHNPHMARYEPIPPGGNHPTIPAARGVAATGAPDCYRVTDKVHTLPAGLWDSDVVSTYEFIDVEGGVFVRIRSPMGVVMESLWLARETADGAVELVEEQVISASRLLMGTVKSMSEAGWKDIHSSMIKKAQE